jgi:hypothetical protein
MTSTPSRPALIFSVVIRDRLAQCNVFLTLIGRDWVRMRSMNNILTGISPKMMGFRRHQHTHSLLGGTMQNQTGRFGFGAAARRATLPFSGVLELRIVEARY